MRKIFLFAFVCLALAGKSFALFEEEPVISTQPIGTPFYRHLANDVHLDLRELEKFEKRGFGRTEICQLILISSSTGVPLKTYGKRRLKDNISMRQFADEAHLDYHDLTARARQMKTEIEAKGDKNLPPPVFEPTPTPTPVPDKKKKKEKEKKETKKEEIDDEAD